MVERGDSFFNTPAEVAAAFSSMPAPGLQGERHVYQQDWVSPSRP